jgi:hypothetical protein
MPNLAELNIATYRCAVDLNGLSNFKNLKSVKLEFDGCLLELKEFNVILNPTIFDKK